MTALMVLDCYRDQTGGARNFLPHLRGETRVIRAPHEDVPPTAQGMAGLVVTGSAATLREPVPWIEASAALVRDAVDRGVPVLGVCFGHQLIPWALLGNHTVQRSPTPELGWDVVRRNSMDDPLLQGVPGVFTCFLSHRDEVVPGTHGLTVLASSAGCAVQAYRMAKQPVWGVQFHAEMGFEEARELVEDKLAAEAPAELSRAVDARDVAATILGRFEKLCGVEAGATRLPRK